MTTSRFARTALRIVLAAATAAALLLALYAAAGHWLAPRLIRSTLDDFARERLGARLELREVAVDPWRLAVVLGDAHLHSREGEALASFDRLAVGVDAASLWSGRVRLNEVVLAAPRAEIIRAPDGTHNWSAVLAAVGGGVRGPAPRLQVGRLAVEGGEIRYRDVAAAADVRATRIAFELRDFSTEAGAPARLSLSATLPDGATLAVKGTLAWPTLGAEGTATVRGVAAPTVLRLAGAPFAATRGTLQASAHFSLLGTARSLVLEELEANATDLELALPQGTLSASEVAIAKGRYAVAEAAASFGRVSVRAAALAAGNDEGVQAGWQLLALDGFDLSLHDKTVRIERAALAGLSGRDRVDAQGASSLAGMLVPAAPPVAGPAAEPVQPAAGPAWRLLLARFEAEDSAWQLERAPDGGKRVTTMRAAFPQIAADALQFAPPGAGGIAAERVVATGGSIAYAERESAAGARSLELNEVALSAAQLSYPQGDAFPVGAAFSIGPAGKVSAEGELDPGTLAATLALKASGIPLAQAQPWLGPPQKLRIAAGSLDVDGRLRLAGATSATFEGRVAALGLHLAEAGSKQSLFSADAVRAEGATLVLSPASVAIAKLELLAPAGRLAIGEDGKLVFGTLGVGGAPVPQPEAQAAAPLPLSIAETRMRDGRLDFTDRSIQPAFRVRIDELAGTIGGLDTSRDSTAKVALDGRVDKYGSARIRGELQTFAPGTRTDLQLSLRNVDMTSLDPYARRFAGYRIDAGKLSADLRYRARNGRLEGENRFVLDKLKLGERVDSPNAADLPLDLAIALLTDGEGRIRLEIPVRGDLSNPSFDFGQIVSQAIGGAIGKLVSAPFRLLASLFGGDERDIDHILFEPGSAALRPPEREKVAALAQALAARPQLGLRVAATFDGAADGDALRRAKLPVDPAALLRLAQARADAIRQAMVQQGTAADRVELAAPQAVSMAATAAADDQGVPTGLTLDAH